MEPESFGSPTIRVGSLHGNSTTRKQALGHSANIANVLVYHLGEVGKWADVAFWVLRAFSALGPYRILGLMGSLGFLLFSGLLFPLIFGQMGP